MPKTSDDKTRWDRTAKPAGSPLWKHPAGYWAKKHRGRTVYFGRRYAPWQDAMEDYRTFQADPERYLNPGLAAINGHSDSAGGPALEDVLNEFIHARLAAVERGDLSPVSWEDYRRTCTLIAETLGRRTPVDRLTPARFRELLNAVAQRWGATRRAKLVTQTKMVFRWARDEGHIAALPQYGPDFKPPAAKAKRRDRRRQTIFTRGQIRKLIDKARSNGSALETMILLGINGGFGNADLGRLEFQHVDRRRRLIDFPRPKTGIDRVAPLWPETLDALARWTEKRPVPRNGDGEHDDLVFITMHGVPWFRPAVLTGDADDDGSGGDRRVNRDNPISKEFTKLLKSVKLTGRGFGFYTLRRTFQTIADETQDFPAVSRIMGHELAGMRRHYVAEISTKRLRVVTNHVRHWLFK